jgi:opacity protein-like surface antigen
MGDWSDGANTGFGGTATYERSFSPNIMGQVYAGYITFGGDEADGFSYSYSMIPIMAGVKYFFQPGKGFYANALLGVHLFTADIDYPEEYEEFFTVDSETSTEFAFGVGAGYEIPVGGKNAVDISAHYMLISDANYIGARIAYRFGL